ncbi:MAG: alpha/beta fold hydrolase [Deltaproteobacteria bacterium]|nr:alpha/beta fold hydrolase [Deltaproteobacteria bacterium]
MNPFAYRTTSLAIKTLSSLSKARINIHGKENIPCGSIIFVINHFTRIETLFLPYHIYKLTEKLPVWSLADYSLFKGALGSLLDKLGAVSTKNPDRDLLIVKSLLTGEASWIIYPEGLMVKTKKIIEKGRFMISYSGGKRPPHTGAAALALRTEFYRQRLERMSQDYPDEAKRLKELFQIDSIEPVLGNNTYIVPVNLTYYPIRAKENALSNLALKLVEDISERMIEEIMTEGTMLLSGVDVDIRFGKPIQVKQCLKGKAIERDIRVQRKINFNDTLPSRTAMRKEALKIMQCYMSAIYSMTTVNHDHLFASILKLFPFKRIKEYDLRRRVFVAITAGLVETGVNLHPNLRDDQLHLLTDDRFSQFADFINVAQEKGVIKRNGKTLEKDRSKFSSLFDFHQARIENPIAVIANEVETLTLLQRHVRRIAWQPGFWLRRKIARHFMKKAVFEFEEDYDTFFKDGESKKKDVGMPFLVKGKSRGIGVLLVHGYMAAPLEVKGLAQYLGRRGLWVYVPRLKGHGTSPDDLATRTYLDWVTSVDEGYAVIRSLCRRVVVGGFSTGAGLALDLSARVEDLAGVFAISAPLRLQDLSAKFVPAVDVWNRLMKRFKLDGAKKEFVENQPENPHINYSRNPISGIRELERLMNSVAPKLPSIQVPVLVAQSRNDPVVDPRGSRRIFERLGSQDKKYALFNFNRHGILLGEGASRVYDAIGNFIEHIKKDRSFH